MSALLRRLMCALSVAFAATTVQAQTSDDREADDAIVHAYAHATAGPSTVKLRDLATLSLPAGFVFVPAAASGRLLHGRSNSADGATIGIVIPAQHFDGWFVAVSAVETGHVSAAEVAAFDSGDVRAAFASSVRRGNANRMRQGFTALDAGSFLEPPRHEPALSRYTTAIRVFESGPSSGDDDTAIVDVRLFGRTHMLRLSLVDTLSDYARHRPALARVVDAVSFLPGQGGADFFAGRDPLASHVLDVVFGGRTRAEVTAEDAEEAAAAKRLAAQPKETSISAELKMAAFAVLGLLSVVAGILAFTWGGRAEEKPARSSTIDRALRTTKR